MEYGAVQSPQTRAGTPSQNSVFRALQRVAVLRQLPITTPQQPMSLANDIGAGCRGHAVQERMHIRRLHFRGFKRFHDLTVEIPGEPRLVVMAGPNGSGKSSLIDAVRLWHGGHGSGEGWFVQDDYHRKAGEEVIQVQQMVEVDFVVDANPESTRKLIYARSAYRHEPDFSTSSIQRSGDLLDAPRSQRMIETESKVSDNYQRLISATLDDLFVGGHDAETVAELRERHIGRVRDSVRELFPYLELQGPGDPLSGGTFFFRKGDQPEFHYKNLSGGEKAGFDLILDLVMKRVAYDDTIFFIDEPELHLNTRVQAALLEVLLNLTPAEGQLWVATHSIGMMRKAAELDRAQPGSVVFLDFEDHDFNVPVTLVPVQPDRAFWTRALETALGDLALLVAPDRVVLCEGRPVGAMNTAKAEFDARCYRQIFAAEFPRTDFVSVGNAAEVSTDRVELGRTIQTIVTGTELVRVVDRDLRSDQEIQDLLATGTRVLGRRHLESYLLDGEVIDALCERAGHADLSSEARQAFADAVGASVHRGNAPDDVKSAAGEFCVRVRQLLALTFAGSTAEAFLADTMAGLIKPDMAVYVQLRHDVLGV